MTSLDEGRAATRIPPLIKRNTALFAITQSFVGVGYHLAYGLGPLMVVSLMGTAILSGLSVALLGASRFLVAYPIGKITDTYGRRPGIITGLLVGMLGGFVVGLSLVYQSLTVFLVGLLLFGMGMSAAQQLRVGAADMFPPSRRAEALGYVLMGSIVGVIIGPILVSSSEQIAPGIGLDPLGLPWLLLPALIVPSILLVLLARPDPKEIGANLARYYPGLKLPPPAPKGSDLERLNTWDLLRRFPTRFAIVANSAGQGNMTIVMVLTSLVLHHHGHGLAEISISQALHSFGMYAFSIPFGRWSDRFGHRTVMLAGVGASLIGAGLVAFTDQWWSITLGTFLVGAGWSAANIASTAQIASAVTTYQRGRAIGFHDTIAAGVSVVLSLITGLLVHFLGLGVTGLLAAGLAAMPFMLLLQQPASRTAGTGSAPERLAR